MPPRMPFRGLNLSLSSATRELSSTTSGASSIPSFLLPFLLQHSTPPTSQPQTRHASILASLSDRPGAYNRRIRRGRGPASGKGGKSGRGSDGQKQHGKVPEGFNGGQTPEHIVHGKYGFKNLHATAYSPLNLSSIQTWIDSGRLDPSKPITLREIISSNIIHGVEDGGVKLLGDGASQLKVPIHIVVSRASQSAIAAVEALGGTVVTRFYTPQAIQRIVDGKMHPFVSLRWNQEALFPNSDRSTALIVPGAESFEERVKALGYSYRLPDPSGRKDLEYYRDIKHRGYLAHEVKEGELPNLFFKQPVTPEQIKELKKLKGRDSAAKKMEVENKLW